METQFVRKMASVSRVRPRFVVTLPRSIRKQRVKVGDNVVWMPISESEFLAVVLPPDRYKALADLIGEISLSREARRAAERAFFTDAAKKAGR